MTGIPHGIYHLVYHDIAREDSSWTKWIQSTLPPERLHADLAELDRIGKLVSTDHALDLARQNITPDQPLFALWFDDGYSGVFEFAHALCQSYGVCPAIAVNARFAQREELFWRCQLSYLLETSDIRSLWDQLLSAPPPEHEDPARTLWTTTLRQYSTEFRARLETCFQKECPGDVRPSADDLFMDQDQLKTLGQEGWLLANHSAGHAAITPNTALDDALDDFAEGGKFLAALPGGRPELWVMPFDYDVVKTAVDASASEFLKHADLLVRADPSAHSKAGHLGRYTIGPNQSAHLNLADHFSKRPLLQRILRRLRR